MSAPFRRAEDTERQTTGPHRWQDLATAKVVDACRRRAEDVLTVFVWAFVACRTAFMLSIWGILVFIAWSAVSS